MTKPGKLGQNVPVSQVLSFSRQRQKQGKYRDKKSQFPRFCHFPAKGKNRENTGTKSPSFPGFVIFPPKAKTGKIQGQKVPVSQVLSFSRQKQKQGKYRDKKSQFPRFCHFVPVFSLFL